MNYTMKNAGNAFEVAMRGSFTFSDNESFRDLVLQVGKGEMKSCLLDIAGVDFIDSAGLGLLVLIKEAADRARVDIRMRGAQGQVRKMLDISQFAEVIPYD
jgi:anti-anti-sigma factor